MITLITGAPGAGKSAALVSMLEGIAKDRAVFVYNVPELKVPHVPLEDPLKWFETVPDGSVIVIDEVQDIWRPTGPGQKPIPSISSLETHRHRGLDFFIITQGPNLLNSNVRALVGRHVHLRDVGFLGRWWYEWPECCDNVRTAWKNAPIKKRYKLPKHVFGLYKSASVHVKPVRGFPTMLIVAVLALAGSVAAAIFVTRSISQRIGGSDASPTPALNAQNSSPGTGPLPHTAPSPSPPVVFDYTLFVPRVSHQPETAPAYDELRKVAVMPVVVGGICRPSGCKCYTQQGTDTGMTSDQCRDWLANPPFDPYQAPPPADPRAPASVPADNVAQTPGTLSLRF